MRLEDIKDPEQRRRFAAAAGITDPAKTLLIPIPPKPIIQQKYVDQTFMGRVGPVVQKQQAPVPRKADNKTRVSRKNGQHGPVVRFSVEAHFFYSDRYGRDIDGAMSTTLDCLVKAGVIPDDNRFVVPRQISEGHDCAKGEERVEVTIEEIIS